MKSFTKVPLSGAFIMLKVCEFWFYGKGGRKENLVIFPPIRKENKKKQTNKKRRVNAATSV